MPKTGKKKRFLNDLGGGNYDGFWEEWVAGA
jgi:hypothetical protein